MGSTQTLKRRKIHINSPTMKTLIVLASFAAAACAMNVAIDKREASMAINSRFRRGSGLGSNIEKECVKKQCKFEEYLESQENQDKAMNRNVRKELKDGKRSGNNWHQDLFNKYYSDCYTRVKSAGLHIAPWSFGKACYYDQFAVKREAYYRETKGQGSNNYDSY